MIDILRQLKCTSTEIENILDRHTNGYACLMGEKTDALLSDFINLNRMATLLGKNLLSCFSSVFSYKNVLKRCVPSMLSRLIYMMSFFKN